MTWPAMTHAPLHREGERFEPAAEEVVGGDALVSHLAVPLRPRVAHVDEDLGRDLRHERHLLVAGVPPGQPRELLEQHLRVFRAALPRETVAFIDEFKQRLGLRNRSQALLQLIEQGRQAAQQ